jgi:hypothetical protein
LDGGLIPKPNGLDVDTLAAELKTYFAQIGYCDSSGRHRAQAARLLAEDGITLKDTKTLWARAQRETKGDAMELFASWIRKGTWRTQLQAEERYRKKEMAK